jgi:hypothetical protein
VAQLRSILRFLNAQHPVFTTFRAAFWSSVGATVFVVLFLMAFQPFGLAGLDESCKYWVIASYGTPDFITIFAACGVLAIAVSRMGIAGKWKVWHHLIFIFAMLLLIGAANYLHDVLIFSGRWLWHDFLMMEVYTGMVGVFPTAGGVILSQFYHLSRNRKAADEVNISVSKIRAGSVPQSGKSVVKIILCGTSRVETLETDSEGLCFVKSDGNYVEVVTSCGGQKPVTHLIRAPLKDVETQLESQCACIVRCHRSYLVNRSRIKGAEGNALGLMLTLDRGALTVPVSRSYADIFRA